MSVHRGRKSNFLMKIFFKLFLFLENLQNGFLTFLISAFNQKLHRETYTQFSDFHDFLAPVDPPPGTQPNLRNGENLKIECTFRVVTFDQKQISEMLKNHYVGIRGIKKV